VRMIQRGNCARFLLEAGTELLHRNLDGHVAVQPRIARPMTGQAKQSMARAKDCIASSRLPTRLRASRGVAPCKKRAKPGCYSR